jgi:hypothetical protein
MPIPVDRALDATDMAWLFISRVFLLVVSGIIVLAWWELFKWKDRLPARDGRMMRFALLGWTASYGFFLLGLAYPLAWGPAYSHRRLAAIIANFALSLGGSALAMAGRHALWGRLAGAGGNHCTHLAPHVGLQRCDVGSLGRVPSPFVEAVKKPSRNSLLIVFGRPLFSAHDPTR